ncbi:hypothetical protein [Belliella aquatica]|uniref:Uncharacterized protein n=1 Tax=Belliella aquatica TaxID=1323734 RepID=A0ABQ1LKL1_9BACT|nr:hypothetical protein [Belliella aquatica]MCH7404179.1 hypothetical protein [Belliella aquatica]GGC25942.1 hypothetical protein GCM10010993_01290 [Belliella aquatica]
MKSTSDKHKDSSSDYVRKEVDFLLEMASPDFSSPPDSFEDSRILIVLENKNKIEKCRSQFKNVLGSGVSLHVIHNLQFSDNLYTDHFDLIIFQNNGKSKYFYSDAEVIVPNGASESFKNWFFKSPNAEKIHRILQKLNPNL